MTGRSVRRTAASVFVSLLVIGLLAACSGAGASTESSAAPSSAPNVPVTTGEAAMAAVVAAHPEFTDVRPRDPSLIGQSSWWEARPASGVGAFVVQVYQGWGDCPAGCIDSHTWTFAVAPDGGVRLVKETGSAVPSDLLRPSGQASGQPDRIAVGIAGRVTSGPVCPVEQNPPDPACAPRPVAGARIRVSDPSGSEVASTTTDDAGTYVIALPPGDYLVSGDPVDGLMGTPEPVAASVTDGRLTQVDLTYDTGIR